MPEGDTIHRAARTLGRWLEGRTITGARTVHERLPADRLVGMEVVAVEARAKHLLVRLSGGPVLHTHMGMTGSWHVYTAGEGWRKPRSQARIVLEAGDRVAVCFNAPVVELLTARGLELHPVLTRLGPDVLAPVLDHEEVARRAARAGEEVTVAELLLDQRVVGGIGNIWRCETLFLNGVDPWTPHLALRGDGLRRLVETAAALMQASVAEGSSRPRPWVYGRAGRTCRRCRAIIARDRIGPEARTVYWCPSCQPAVTA